jgi:hypothetical protein
MNCPCGESTLEEQGIEIGDVRRIWNRYRLEDGKLHYVQWEDDETYDLGLPDTYICACGRPLWAEMVATLEQLDRE